MPSYSVNRKRVIQRNKKTLELEKIALEEGLFVEILQVHLEVTTELAEQWDLVGW